METKLCSSVILIYGWVKSDKFDLMIMLRLSFSPPHHNSSFVIILLPIAPLSLSLFLISPSSPWFLNSVHLPLLPPFYPFSLSSWGTPARIPFILFFLLPPPLPLSISHYLHVHIYYIYRLLAWIHVRVKNYAYTSSSPTDRRSWRIIYIFLIFSPLLFSLSKWVLLFLVVFTPFEHILLTLPWMVSTVQLTLKRAQFVKLYSVSSSLCIWKIRRQMFFFSFSAY